MTFKRFVIVLVLLLTFYGCATRMYQGEPLSNSETSIIKGSGFFEGVYIIGKDHKGELFSSSNVEVKSGPQKIMVHYFNLTKGAFYGRDRLITFNTEPGHKYIVKGKGNDITIGNHQAFHINVWVEDVGTGKIVFGQKSD